MAEWVSRCACCTRCVCHVLHHGTRVPRHRESAGEVADFAVDLGHQVPGRVRDPGIGALVTVQQGCTGTACQVGIEDRFQHFVLHVDQFHCAPGDVDGVRDDGRDTLPPRNRRIVSNT